MKLIPFYLFTFIWGYSGVISAPINQNLQEIKHEKASIVANHLLKELANETRANQVLNKESEQDYIEDIIPVIDDIYPIYDEESSSSSSSEINDFNDIFPIDEQELIRFLEENEESDKDTTPVIHHR